MTTRIRSGQQLYIDESLQFNAKKGVGIAAGTVAGDVVEYSQMNQAISDAVSGVGNSIHVPVADLMSAKAIALSGRADKMIMLIETLGLFHFDAESTATSNNGTVIRPDDIDNDAMAGRWIKMSSILTTHELLSNILGNGSYHLSLAERDKLTGIADEANYYLHPDQHSPSVIAQDALNRFVTDAQMLVWNNKQNAGNYVLDGDNRLTNARVTIDVYPWAKAGYKPDYGLSEITGKPSALSSFLNDLGNYGGFAYAHLHPYHSDNDGRIAQWNTGYDHSQG